MHGTGLFSNLPRPNITAILASYPSGSRKIVEARDNLMDKMIGQKFLNSSTSRTAYVTPCIMHNLLPAVERTPQYIFVGLSCEAGTFSPYLCPMGYKYFDFPSVSSFLHRRADLHDFLGRLCGKRIGM